MGVKTSWIYNFIHTVNKIIMTNNIIIKLLIKTKNGRESFAKTPKVLGAGGRKPPSSNILLPCAKFEITSRVKLTLLEFTYWWDYNDRLIWYV